jgi:hypothetical protein
MRRNALVAQVGVLVAALAAIRPETAVVAGFIILFVLIPVSFTIILFAWPRRLIPPALRQQAGALGGYLDRRRASRKRH